MDMQADRHRSRLPERRIHTMKIFRHPGLIIAVFWCAAMVVAPMAAASGAGQDTNNGQQGMGPWQAGPGNNQMQQDPGQDGNTNTFGQQGNGRNSTGPGHSGRPEGMGRGNMTGFMNMTNMTPPEKPDWDPDNATAMNMTGMHGHEPGNMTGFNMTVANVTDIPPPGNWDPATMTAANQSWHGHGDRNMTAPPGQQNTDNQGPQANQNRQQNANNNNNSDDSLITELMSWLKAHGVS
jgi:hypothetical protein